MKNSLGNLSKFLNNEGAKVAAPPANVRPAILLTIVKSTIGNLEAVMLK
jgi:hypothetical protein